MEKKFTEQLSQALSERIEARNYLCPICHRRMALMSGLFVLSLHKDNINPSIIDPECVPIIPLICQECGFISQHAVVTLLGSKRWEIFCKEYGERHEQQEKKKGSR